MCTTPALLQYSLGYKSSLKQLRSGKSKLIILAANTPALRKSELEYYALLTRTLVSDGPFISLHPSPPLWDPYLFILNFVFFFPPSHPLLLRSSCLFLHLVIMVLLELWLSTTAAAPRSAVTYTLNTLNVGGALQGRQHRSWHCLRKVLPCGLPQRH